MAVSLGLVLSGCIGGDAPIGRAGVYLDGAGRVTAMFVPCDEKVEAVLLSKLNEEDVEAQDPLVGEWKARSPEHPNRLTLNAPASGWDVVQDPGPLEPGALYYVEAGFVDSDNGTTASIFRLSDLTDLNPGQVIGFDQEKTTAAELEQSACL